MKNATFFWNDWSSFEKRLYLSLLSLLALTILYFSVFYFIGIHQIIDWLHKTDIKTVVIPFLHFHVGLYEFPLKAESFAIVQSFVPSAMIVRDWPAMVLLLTLALGFTVVPALITTLSRFWYLAGMSIFAVALILLKTDMLHFFGSYNKTGLIAAFTAYYPLSYFFQYTATRTTLAKRLAAFFAATILLALFVRMFAGVNHLALHLINYGIYVPLIITIIFIFMVGHEVVSTLLKAVSGSGKTPGKNHLFHFLLLSALYLLNVLLVYLRNSRRFDLDIYIIDSFWLFVISALAGIWGFRDRENTYAGIFPFRPTGALLYLTLAIMSFSTIAYFFLTGNDSFIEVIEDAITFSQLGYSIIFIIYVLANFFQLLHNNIGMASVMYKPRYMPYFTARLMGFIVVLGLFLKADWIPYYQAVAGYHSGIGDIYYISGEFPAAREYYKLANNYSSTSHRANFALASIAKNDGDNGAALNYLLASVKKNPTEYAYAGIADIYASHNKYFEALFALQEGLKTFPGSGQLNNNLGLTFAETDIMDSTLYFLKRAQKNISTRKIAQTNLLAVYAKENLPIRGDSLLKLAKETKYLPEANNLQILARLRGTRTEDRFLLKFNAKSNEETEQILYNYNKILTHPEVLDTGFWNTLNLYYSNSADYWMKEQLEFAGALAAFANGEKTKAFTAFHALLSQTDTKIALYNGYLGRMALASEAPRLAIRHFEQAIRYGNRGVFQEYAFSLTEAGEDEKALKMWSQLGKGDNAYATELATGMIKTLSAATIKDMLGEAPLMQYNFIRYRSEGLDAEELNGFIQNMEDDNFRAACWLFLAEKFLRQGNKDASSGYLKRLEHMPFNNPYLKTSFFKIKILLEIQKKDMAELQSLLNAVKKETAAIKPYTDLARACLEARYGTSPKADRLFESAGYRDPFFEPAVLEAARYFSRVKGDEEKAYDLLLNAANINEYSVEIQEAYILQCLRVGMLQYAEEAMNGLKTFAPKKELNDFIPAYKKIKSDLENRQSTW